MKKLILLVCLLAMLLTLTGVAAASPAKPQSFRIDGHTRVSRPCIQLPPPAIYYLKSDGDVSGDIQGTFVMDEYLFVYTQLKNIGYMTITANKRDKVFIWFAGDTDGYSRVWGHFWVIYATGAYAGFKGGGKYEGIPDMCRVLDPATCTLECNGFYVDFTFNSYGH